jgi:hypothetical protein
MSAFTSAAQGDSCRTTKKFLQNLPQKTFPLLDACKQAIDQELGVGQAVHQMPPTKCAAVSTSWPSGSPGTIYDNNTDFLRFLGARVQSIAELRYQYYSSHYDYLPALLNRQTYHHDRFRQYADPA